MPRWYCNPPLHVQNAGIVRLKRCPLILASITTTARDADRCYVPTRVTAVSTVPLVQYLVRQYKKHGRKIMVQGAVANLNAVLDPFHS